MRTGVAAAETGPESPVLLVVSALTRSFDPPRFRPLKGRGALLLP
jgi:hypothetical protein